MPDILDLLPEAPEDLEVLIPPSPQSLQFRHRTVGGTGSDADNIVFPWYWTRLDHPTLNGKPNAILTVTPVGRIVFNDETPTARLIQNPHPVGVLYRDLDSRWYIYNLGLEGMELRADFHVAVHEARRPK